mmetsp:Transcript_10279/g.29894  ORF Transcript_10279/g.29894 Transcript_10279/m.29894 type:complete len:114 (-) Transcript_10279:627-968(-)
MPHLYPSPRANQQCESHSWCAPSCPRKCHLGGMGHGLSPQPLLAHGKRARLIGSMASPSAALRATYVTQGACSHARSDDCGCVYCRGAVSTPMMSIAEGAPLATRNQLWQWEL